MATDQWMNTEVVMCDIYIYKENGKLFSHKEKGDPAICDNMNRPQGHYAKWNKLEKDKYHMISLICGIKKNQNQTNQTN